MFLIFIQGKSVFVPWIVWEAVSTVHLLAAYQFWKNDASTGETGSIWWPTVDVSPQKRAIACTALHGFSQNCKRIKKANFVCKLKVIWFANFTQRQVSCLKCQCEQPRIEPAPRPVLPSDDHLGQLAKYSVEILPRWSDYKNKHSVSQNDELQFPNGRNSISRYSCVYFVLF